MTSNQAQFDAGATEPDWAHAGADVSPTEIESLPWRSSGLGREEAVLNRDGLRLIARRLDPDAGSGLEAVGPGTGLLLVIAGIVEEERYLPEENGLRYEVAVLKAGSRSDMPAGGFRRVEAVTRAITLNVDSPAPLVDPDPAELFRRLVGARRPRLVRSGVLAWLARVAEKVQAA